jgi:hypothetical protein
MKNLDLIILTVVVAFVFIGFCYTLFVTHEKAEKNRKY